MKLLTDRSCMLTHASHEVLTSGLTQMPPPKLSKAYWHSFEQR